MASTAATALDRELTALFGPSADKAQVWAEIRLFEHHTLPLINELWELAQLQGYAQIFKYIYSSQDQECERERIRRLDCIQAHLERELGAEQTGTCAASVLLNAQLWQPAFEISHRHGIHSYDQRRQAQQQLLLQAAMHALDQHKPADWEQRIYQRLLAHLTAHSMTHTPDFAECINYMLELHTPTSERLLDALTFGNWAVAWADLCAAAGYTPPEPPPATIFGLWHELAPTARLQHMWQYSVSRYTLALIKRIYRTGQLSNATFRTLLELLPTALSHISYVLRSVDQGAQQLDAALHQRLDELTNTVLWEMVQDFRPESWPVLQQVPYFTGGRYLLRLAEEVEQRGITRLATRSQREHSAACTLRHLLQTLEHGADDDAALIELLRRLSTQTLLTILPYTLAYEQQIIAALGWDVQPLLALLRRLESQNPARSADPSAGVIHRDEILACTDRLTDAQLPQALEQFEPSYPAAMVLVRAALDLNRKELRRLFGRRSQLAARALGLLPLNDGELLQRYQQLTTYQHAANTSAASRKNFERAAAHAGLASLALQAGFASATRLEWAMGDQLGGSDGALGRCWEIAGYSVQLVLRDGKPVLTYDNGKRQLKHAPKLVTRDYDYKAIKQTLSEVQDQERRYRQAFLDAMRRGTKLTADELALLRRSPLAVALLERLVLIDEAGAIGLFSGEDGALIGLYGERVLIHGGATIAHPLTLQEADALNSWQAEIVRRQIVQPFKQIFREIYVITPAEREAVFSSGRLASRRMRGQQATAVLANLGWICEYSSADKFFHDLNLVAHFESGTFYYDDDAATTGALSFSKLRYEHGEEHRVALADVPALIFSEVMRDLDLVTVVAHQSAELGTSREVIQQRASLVRTTMAALGMQQVRIDEPHVHIQGSRASYRIHLATAAVYTEAGQYLCIVPERKKRKSIYLPFEEGGEPLVSEIISKTLLLANDRTISDPTIIAQIGHSPQLA